MSNDYFRFKHFCIRHDRCAMKVGTDGVLLGAWGCVEGKRILDIGTGTGLIALMAAQRNPEAEVLGIDIDEAAVLQAKENIADSPFRERVGCVLLDVMALRPTKQFDAILCNPPFFTEDTMPDDKQRALARNSKNLPFAQLIKKVASLLSEKGRFSVVIPNSHMQEFIGLCLANNLYLERRCIVRTKSNKPPRRALLTFTRDNGQWTTDNGLPPAPEAKAEERTTDNGLQNAYNIQEEIILTNDDGSRSEAYKSLTKDFYL